MSQHYSNPSRANDPYALPNIETFYLTAREVAERDDDLIFEYMKRHEFRLAAMNSRDRERMFDTMIEAEGISGGWFWCSCFPGCMPDSDPFGPFDTEAEAVADAQSNDDDSDPRECVQCGEPFNPDDSTAKDDKSCFCSAECEDRDRIALKSRGEEV